MHVSFASALAFAASAGAASPRYVMYFDQWHKATPPPHDVTAGVNYVITAFAPSTAFNWGRSYTPFMPLEQVRALFEPGTKVCMAIGGWGDTAGFSAASESDESRRRYAANVATALQSQGYDCVDVDWEYPGGNGEDYRRNLNAGKIDEIETYPLLLKEIKKAIGTKELSVAVPGKVGDMIAFTKEKVPLIDEAVDFVNVMTYDIMNRRDNVTNHHSSITDSLATVDTYIQRGMSPSKLNLGFAFYAKWFTTASGTQCTTPTGCPTAELERPDGSDTGRSGAVTFEQENFTGGSALEHALANGKMDAEKGGMWFWDADKSVYWTWDAPDLITRKFNEIVKARKLGGVMAWSLAQDSHDWSRFKALQAGVRSL